MAFTREALNSVSNDVSQLLALIASRVYGDQFKQGYGQSQQALTQQATADATQAKQADVNYAGALANAAMAGANPTGSPIGPIPAGQATPPNVPPPDVMAILAHMIQGNPDMARNPNFAPAFTAAQAMAPQPFTANAGDVYGMRDRITGKVKVQGIVPKQVTPAKPELPPGFAQMIPEAQSRFFNELPGRAGATKPTDFKSPADDSLSGVDYIDDKNMKWRVFYDAKTGEEKSRRQVGPAQQAGVQGGKNAQYSVIAQLVKDIERGKKDDYVGGALSGGGGLLGWAREKTGAIGNEEAMFRSNVASLGNQLLYLRSGAQINEQEYERLMKEMPEVTLAPNVFDARMQAFKRQLSAILQSKGVNSAELGIRSEEPQSSGSDSSDGFKVGQVYEDASGNRAKYLGNGQWQNQ